MDPSKINHGYGMPNAGTEHWQTVVNESWPLIDEHGKRHARGIPDRQPIDVQVRVHFEHDGVVWLDGQADRWTRTHVHVAVVDPRLQVNGVWVLAGDVRRA